MKKKDKLALVRKFYPGAHTTIDSVNRLIDFIEDELDMEPARVMLADSICSDDVNSIQYPVRAQEFLGPFKMGGLDGYPFTGLTGMGAFASHVPDDGAVMIYYGPHIGISADGIVGEINRHGQHKPSGCCGAAKGALNKLLNNAITVGATSEIDYQMNTIEQLFLSNKTRITAAQNQLMEATEVMYEAIDKRINELVQLTTYNCNYIILVGAILINSDSDIGSFTSTKRFETINLKSGERRNLLHTVII